MSYLYSCSLLKCQATFRHLHTHLPLLLVHHVQLLLAQPGLHLSCVKVVLLGLVHGVQKQLSPLRLSPEQVPQLGQLVVARPDTVCFGAAYGCDDCRPLQDVLDPAPVALQLSLKCLEERRRTITGTWRWLFRSSLCDREDQ